MCWQRLISTAPDKDYRSTIMPVILCPAQPQNDCVQPCGWKDSESRCAARGEWVVEKFTQVIKKNTNPICTIISAVLESGCTGSEKGVCTKNSKCEWSPEEGEPLLFVSSSCRQFLSNDFRIEFAYHW